MQLYCFSPLIINVNASFASFNTKQFNPNKMVA